MMKKLLLSAVLAGSIAAVPAMAQSDHRHSHEMPGGMMNKPMSEWTMQDMMSMMRMMQRMMPMSGMNGMQNLEGREFDRAFVQGMLEHHQDVIERSRDVAANAGDNRVRGWARSIAAAQQDEVAALRSLLSDLGSRGIDERMPMSGMQGGMMGTQGMGGGMMGMGNGARSSRQGAQTDPERAYVLYVVDHRADAMRMASEVLRRSDDARVLQLARNILVNQSREVLEMKSWLKRQ